MKCEHLLRTQSQCMRSESSLEHPWPYNSFMRVEAIDVRQTEMLIIAYTEKWHHTGHYKPEKHRHHLIRRFLNARELALP